MCDDILNANGMTELHLAAYHGELDWVRNCLEGGLNVKARDKGGDTPLHWVADMGMVGSTEERVAIVELLIAAGAEVNAKDNAGVSVFCRAVLAGNYRIVKRLIGAGAEINVPDNRGDTPLAFAMANEDVKMIEIIEQANYLSP